MKLSSKQYRRAALSWVAGALVGCSGASELLKGPASLASGTMDKIAAIELPATDPDPTGSPTEIYTRIARGANACWFGVHGTLKANHIFHADAEPVSRGGRVEIVIHERDTTMPNPRGNRAFRIRVLPSGENAKLEVENIRFPILTGQAMTADVRRWARNDLTCSPAAQTKGWDVGTQGAPSGSPPAAPSGPAPNKN